MLSKTSSHHLLFQVILVITMMNSSKDPSFSSTPPNNLVNSLIFDMECNLPLDHLLHELFTLVTIDTLYTQASPFLLKYQTRIL